MLIIQTKDYCWASHAIGFYFVEFDWSEAE